MTDEEKAKELTIKNVTDGKNKYFSWGFYKGCVVGLEYNNKQIAELEEKISVLLSCKNCSENKGGWICAKEYENKCLAQKIDYQKKADWQQGAEFGYNKANEWHFVKDGKYPAHSNRVLVFTDEGVGFGIYGLDNQKWYTYDTGFDVIAWKEIVLPKESE